MPRRSDKQMQPHGSNFSGGQGRSPNPNLASSLVRSSDRSGFHVGRNHRHDDRHMRMEGRSYRARSSGHVPHSRSHRTRSIDPSRYNYSSSSNRNNFTQRNSLDSRKRPRSPEPRHRHQLNDHMFDRSRRQRISGEGSPDDARIDGSHSLSNTNRSGSKAEMLRARPPSRSNESQRDENTNLSDRNANLSAGSTENMNSYRSNYQRSRYNRPTSTSYDQRRLPLASRHDFSSNPRSYNSNNSAPVFNRRLIVSSAPRFSNNNTVPELIQIAHDNLAALTPSATASFWNKVSKQMSGRNAPNSLLPNGHKELGRRLSQIVGHTTRTLKSFCPVDLSQTIYSMSKTVDALRKRRRRGEDCSDLMSHLFLDSDLILTEELFRSFAFALRDKLEQFGSRNLSDVAYAYALLRYVPEFDDGSDLFDHLATRAVQCRTEFNVQDISNMLWAYATVDKPLDLFDAIGNPHRFQSPSRDKVEISFTPERNVIPADELSSNGCLCKMWWFFCRLCTLFIPDVLLCCIGLNKTEAKHAWREKVAMFVIMILSSGLFIGVSGVAPLMFCMDTFTVVRYW